MSVMRFVLCLALAAAPPAALARQAPPKPQAPPLGAKADYHVHLKADLTLEGAMQKSRATGITYGVAVNGVKLDSL